jgi:hypothetical protein|tara:strand:+ start:17243 stop:18751 length:1509 start_codon:yes stop_codon:yes gene_type:complete
LKKYTLLLLLIFWTFIFWNGCKETISGEFSENQPPTTNLTVERINRGNDFRLSSQIQISWFGSDPDGFISGFEYAINDTSESNFSFTTKTDSIFILPISSGQQTDDVLFKVRAVDDKGLADPKGASLIYPIVNSTPQVSINTNQSPPDTLFSVSSFSWNFSDPDGMLNLARTEIAINDTINGWTEIPFTEEDDGQLFISLEVDNTVLGTNQAQVFLGRSYSTLQVNGENLTVPIEVGSRNTFYVRAVDAAGSTSEIDSLSWYIKEQTSNTLFLNDYSGPSSANRQNFHLNLLQQNGISPDIWIINDGEVSQDKVALSNAFPAVIDPTLIKTLSKWDHIYWISNDLDRNITYAQEILDDFFDNGGTSFVNIPMKNIEEEDPVFNFLPVDSIQNGQFLILEDSLVTPTNASITNTLRVESGSFALSGVFPIKGVSGSTSLYQANFVRRTATGGVRAYNDYQFVTIENAEGNVIYFSLDLSNLNGDNNIKDMIQEVVIERLGFKQ